MGEKSEGEIWNRNRSFAFNFSRNPFVPSVKYYWTVPLEVCVALSAESINRGGRWNKKNFATRVLLLLILPLPLPLFFLEARLARSRRRSGGGSTNERDPKPGRAWGSGRQLSKRSKKSLSRQSECGDTPRLIVNRIRHWLALTTANRKTRPPRPVQKNSQIRLREICLANRLLMSPVISLDFSFAVEIISPWPGIDFYRVAR